MMIIGEVVISIVTWDSKKICPSIRLWNEWRNFGIVYIRLLNVYMVFQVLLPYTSRYLSRWMCVLSMKRRRMKWSEGKSDLWNLPFDFRLVLYLTTIEWRILCLLAGFNSKGCRSVHFPEVGPCGKLAPKFYSFATTSGFWGQLLV